MEVLSLIVVGLFVCICVPKYMLDQREALKKQQTTYKFRKLGLAVSQYHETYRAFPTMKKSSGPPPAEKRRP